MIEPSWVPTHIVNTPYLTDDLHWKQRDNSQIMREAFGVNRDEIFYDFYKKIEMLK